MRTLLVNVDLTECVPAVSQNRVLKVRLLPASASSADEKAIVSGTFQEFGAELTWLEIRTRDQSAEYQVHLFGNGFSDVMIPVTVNAGATLQVQPPLKRGSVPRLFEPSSNPVTITELVK